MSNRARSSLSVTSTSLLGGQSAHPDGGDWLCCRCGGHWWCLTRSAWYRLTSRGEERVEGQAPACCRAEEKP